MEVIEETEFDENNESLKIPKLCLARVVDIKKSPTKSTTGTHCVDEYRIKETFEDTEFKKTELEIFNLLNLLRTGPNRFQKVLQEKRVFFKGKMYCVPGTNPIKTHEGVGSIDDLIEVLENTNRMNEFSYSPGLSLAAADHVEDIGKKALVTNLGSESRENARTRSLRYGFYNKVTHDICCESIIFSHYLEAQTIILDLILDDGNISRDNRANIFDSRLDSVGIACGVHNTFGYVTVICFSCGYNTYDGNCQIQHPNTILYPGELSLRDLDNLAISHIPVISRNRLEMYRERGVHSTKKKTEYRGALRYGLKVFSPFQDSLYEGNKYDIVFSFKKYPKSTKKISVVNNSKIFDVNSTMIKTSGDNVDVLYHIQFIRPEKGFIGILIGNMFIYKCRVI